MRQRHPTHLRTTSLLAIAVVLTACGSRLDDDARATAIAAAASSGSRSQVAGQVDGATAPSDAVAGEPTSDVLAGGQSSSTGLDAPQATSGATGPSGVEQGGTAGGTTPQATTQADTRAAPAGGNGGATDVGVTADSIRIFNVSDISGAVPGIFQDAQLAVQAYVAYFTATEGTVYGRRIELEVRDSQLNASRNRSHYEDACNSAFAAVGSMSAFDEGAAGPVGECGLPDLRATAVNPQTINTPTVYSSDAISTQNFPTNHFRYFMETFPGIEKDAGILYINNDTTAAQTQLLTGAARKVGYEWDVIEPVGLAETNYSSFVIKLKNEGVQFLVFTGDIPQAVRLAQAMRQQDYWPTVYMLQQNLYSPRLIQQGGADIEDAYVATSTALREQIERHPELQTYREWLQRVSPDAEPTTQGTYAWGAAMLFVDCLKQIGPTVTRAALVDCYAGTHAFDGNGLYPPQDIGSKLQSNCHVILRIEQAAFVPVDPPDGIGFNCRGKAESPD